MSASTRGLGEISHSISQSLSSSSRIRGTACYIAHRYAPSHTFPQFQTAVLPITTTEPDLGVLTERKKKPPSLDTLVYRLLFRHNSNIGKMRHRGQYQDLSMRYRSVVYPLTDAHVSPPGSGSRKVMPGGGVCGRSRAVSLSLSSDIS